MVVPATGGSVHDACRRLANLRAIYRHEEGTVRKELVKGAMVASKAGVKVAVKSILV